MLLPTAAIRHHAQRRQMLAASAELPDRFQSGQSAGGITPWIATIGGRRLKKPIVQWCKRMGRGFPDASAVITDAYQKDIWDEFIMPAVVGDYGGARDGDTILCFVTSALTARVKSLLHCSILPLPPLHARTAVHFACAVGMTDYGSQLNAFMQTIFPSRSLPNVLGQVVADHGRTQLRLAETEKYPHVTYFLNGGTEERYPGEDRVMVPSPKVATYDLQPEMSAPELTDKAVEAIGSGKYDLIVLNYANPDMVGHTGNLAAAIKAVETVDAGLCRIAESIRRAGGALLITADHGNCEMMRDPETGGPHTSHTANPVPLLLMGCSDGAVANGRLADVAPTLLTLDGLTQTGRDDRNIAATFAQSPNERGCMKSSATQLHPACQ